MDYLQLGSAVVAIYASIVPLYMAARIYKSNKHFFAVSIGLGVGLLIHGLYHYWAFIGDGLLRIIFELVSAALILALTLYYTYLRRIVEHGS